MITCNKCSKEKHESDFYPRNKVCKECTKNRVKEYQRTGKGKEVHRKANKKYYKTDSGKQSREECQHRYMQQPSTKKKQLAKWAVKRATKSGLLIRKPCSVCGDDDSHGHHPDYDRQLDVIWLCAKHHYEWHEINGEGANAL
ncbi:hypothetical protein NVP1181O_67 [Vibrio phage 1.181.O._10N.286.46.C9]|nr:hypothetical protein NVP1181O_67 [Vibrio phage 1.181.O._10N.286.46.C9]